MIREIAVRLPSGGTVTLRIRVRDIAPFMEGDHLFVGSLVHALTEYVHATEGATLHETDPNAR